MERGPDRGAGRVVTTYLARTSPASWPGSSSGMPSKTRLAPPSAHTRSAAGHTEAAPPRRENRGKPVGQQRTRQRARSQRNQEDLKRSRRAAGRAVTAGPEEGREAGQRLVEDDERDGGGVGGRRRGRRRDEERRGVAHRRPLLRRRGSESHGGRLRVSVSGRRVVGAGVAVSKLEPPSRVVGVA